MPSSTGCNPCPSGLGRGLRRRWRASAWTCAGWCRTAWPPAACKAAADETSVSAGIDTAAAPYAAIQECGGTTRAHVIEAINAAALRFEIGGRTVFAKRVMHPGSVIPARSFLAAALAELAPVARGAMADAVVAEAQA
jgi:hypothetical protein